MTATPENVGAVIESGPSDWQVFQQNSQGWADIPLQGRWKAVSEQPKVAGVQVRLVHEDTGVVVAPHLDWSPAATNADGTWTATLRKAPAGGLYRLETRLAMVGQVSIWGSRGDIRHFLAVGDLWVIAGQSNSAGYGVGPVYDPPQQGVHLFNNAMRWTLAAHPLNDSTGTAHAENREGGNPQHAPWLHWARRVRQDTGVPIGLVQTSLGGSPLVSWNPAEEGAHPLYDMMVRVVQAVGGKVRGVLWYQGCSDTPLPQAKTYEKRFVSAVRAWRRNLKLPQLYVLTVQINRVNGESNEDADRGWSLVRQAQRQVPRRLGGCCVVPTLDLPLSDGIHISPAGNLLLAERAALAALANVYDRPKLWQAPDIAAAKAADVGETVELHFAPVAQCIHTTNSPAIPFRVEDKQGVVPVKTMEFPTADDAGLVRLRLGRKLQGPAVVHGAYGANPPQPLCSLENFIPMLGFYGFPIEI